MNLHIIFTETDILLTKHPYASWLDIQDTYSDYKASLGPWDHDEVIGFLSENYPDIFPSAKEQVLAILSSLEETNSVTFDGINNAG